MGHFQHNDIEDLTTVKENFFGDVLSRRNQYEQYPNKSKVIKLIQRICGATIEVLNKQYKITD